MPDATPTYDLVLLLSTAAEEDRRAKILADVEAAISNAGGSIVHNGDWGTRPLSYRIQHQADAEYHLLQFTGPPALIESLRHSLAIADGVLRSRVIKVLPGTPPPPTPTPVPTSAATASGAPGASAAATATAQAEEAEVDVGQEPSESAPEVAEPMPGDAAETDADE